MLHGWVAPDCFQGHVCLEGRWQTGPRRSCTSDQRIRLAQIEHRSVLLKRLSPHVLPEAEQTAGGPFDFVFIDAMTRDFTRATNQPNIARASHDPVRSCGFRLVQYRRHHTLNLPFNPFRGFATETFWRLNGLLAKCGAWWRLLSAGVADGVSCSSLRT